MVPAEQVAAEQRALREAVAGLLAGLTNQSQVARAWNAAGLLTATGQRVDLRRRCAKRCCGRSWPGGSSTTGS